MLVVVVLALFARANAENQTEEFYPNCDLVAVSHVAVRHNENGTLDIDFSWDRKAESYQTIGGPIKQYVVRHGPWEDGEASNETQFMSAAPVSMAPWYAAVGDVYKRCLLYQEQDSVTLKNVKPYNRYFVQVCAVTKSYRFLFQNDLWDHAWIGWMDLSEYGSEDKPLATPDSDATDAEPGTSTKSPSPRCDLVQTSYVSVDENEQTKKLTMHFSWAKKESSYETLGPIDHYLVRHGPVQVWDEYIDESGARYLIVPNDTNSIDLTDITPGGLYGLQICAVFSDDVGLDRSIDWNNEAKTGIMNFTNYNSPAELLEETDTIPRTWPEEEEAVGNASSSEEQADSFDPRCDLVQTSYVSVAADRDTRTLIVTFFWDKKQSSYDRFGSFDHYLVRHGPWPSGGEIQDSEARYMPVANDTTFFELTDLPPNTRYGLQICAISDTDMGIEPSINWRTEAWTGSMDFFSYESYRVLAPDDDATTSSSGTPEVPLRGDVGQNRVHIDRPAVMPQFIMGSDYGILLIALVIIGIISMTVAFLWMALAKKRQNAKVAPAAFDPSTKQGLPIP